jgi:hypothetical protein
MTEPRRISERRAALRDRAKVAQIRILPAPEVQADLFDSAETLLEGIRRREIVAFAGGVLWNDGSVSVLRGGDQRRPPMVFALERAKLRLMGFIEED